MSRCLDALISGNLRLLLFAFKKNMKRKLAPSMKPKLEKEFSEIYQDAVDIVAAEYEVDLPKQCPYSLTDLLP